MSNVASRTSKKRGFGFEIHRLHLQLHLGVMTSKTTASDPEAFPKRLAPEQGNSMAWRAQGHRFSTSVGVIFSVKRCVFVRCLLWLTASGRAPPGRQGLADIDNVSEGLVRLVPNHFRFFPTPFWGRISQLTNG